MSKHFTFYPYLPGAAEDRSLREIDRQGERAIELAVGYLRHVREERGVVARTEDHARELDERLRPLLGEASQLWGALWDMELVRRMANCWLGRHLAKSVCDVAMLSLNKDDQKLAKEIWHTAWLDSHLRAGEIVKECFPDELRADPSEGVRKGIAA